MEEPQDPSNGLPGFPGEIHSVFKDVDSDLANLFEAITALKNSAAEVAKSVGHQEQLVQRLEFARVEQLHDYDKLSLAVAELLTYKNEHMLLWKLIPRGFRTLIDTIFETYWSSFDVKARKITRPNEGDGDDEDWGPSNLQ